MHYRIDEEPWLFVWALGLELPDRIDVGVHAQAPFEGGCRVTFASLEITDVPVQDFRSGD